MGFFYSFYVLLVLLSISQLELIVDKSQKKLIIFTMTN